MTHTLRFATILMAHNPYTLTENAARDILAKVDPTARVKDADVRHSLYLARALSRAPLPYINPQNITDSHQWEAGQ